MARYIRPLSMKRRPSLSATRRPTADLPEATPPSMVTITSRSLDVHAGRAAQRRHLPVGQQAPTARLEPPEAQRAERRAPQPQHLVPHHMEHAAHLAMTAFSDHQAQLGPTRLAIAVRRAKALDLSRSGDPIAQLDALAQRLQRAGGGQAGHQHLVFLGDLVARVSEAICEVAIVGEEEQAGAVGIEPANREEAMPERTFSTDHVEHSSARSLIPRRRDGAKWLVEHHVAMPGGQLDQLALHG